MKSGKFYIYFCIAAALLLSGSCTEQDIPVFESNDSGIYFQEVALYELSSSAETYSDSITYSFSTKGASVKSTMLKVVVRTMGNIRDYDRPVKVAIDPENTTAKEGYHYEFNPEDVVIKAGMNRDTVKIKFNRTEDLLDGDVRITLMLEENEHFKCYLKEYKNTNVFTSPGAQISGVKFKFTVNETYEEPFYYMFFGGTYWGPWTAKKFQTLNNFMGWTVQDWEDAGMQSSPIKLGRFNFVAIRFRKYLQELADAGTPAREADGSLMQLGAAYLVDYSNYDE